MSELLKAALEDANKALSLDSDASIGNCTEHGWFSGSRPLFANLARHVIGLAAELKAAQDQRDEANARAERAERAAKEILADLQHKTAESESRYDCHGGPGTTEPACGACVSCLLRVEENILKEAAAAKQERDALRGQLAEHADSPHAYICKQVAELAAKKEKECEALLATITGWQKRCETSEAKCQELWQELKASRLATETTAKERDALAVRCLGLERIVDAVRDLQECGFDSAEYHERVADVMSVDIPESPNAS